MNKFSVLEHDVFGDVRTVFDGEKYWYAGKDIANLFNIKSYNTTVKASVKEENKKFFKAPTSGGRQKLLFVDREGVKSLYKVGKFDGDDDEISNFLEFDMREADEEEEEEEEDNESISLDNCEVVEPEKDISDIIKVNYDSDRITVSATELHDFLCLRTKFQDWFPRMCEYGFFEGIDFVPIKIEKVRSQKRERTYTSTDYQITVEMAKEICMIQKNDKGKQARQYFIKLEKDWNTPEKVMARALKIANDTLDKVRIQNTKLLSENNEMKPKAEFYDAVTDSKTAISIGDVAKVLDCGMGRNNLFSFLRNKGVLMDGNIPKQEYMNRGYFRVIENKYTKPNGDTCISVKTLVFQKGVDYIRKLIKESK